MKRIKDVLLGIAVTVVATIGIVVALLNGVWAVILREDYKVEAFYAEHPLLRDARCSHALHTAGRPSSYDGITSSAHAVRNETVRCSCNHGI